MFCGPLAESGETIAIPDIEENAFRFLLRYMYCDSVEIEADTVIALLYAAKKYTVPLLADQCLKYVETQMSIDDVFPILEQAHLFDERDLQSKCLAFIGTNAEKVLESTDFQQLSMACLETVLRAEDLHAEEEKVFEAVMRWTDSACQKKELPITDENRRTVLGDLFFLIRFPTMSKEYFADKVSVTNILTDREMVEVFQQLLGKACEAKTFSTKQRSLQTVHEILRFKDSTHLYLCKSGSAHAISFTSSSNVQLVGLLVYGSMEEASHEVSIQIYNSNHHVLSSVKTTELSDGTQKMNTVMLPSGVQIEAGKLYTVSATLVGAHSLFAASGGLSAVVSGSLRFDFSTCPWFTSSTSVDEGQIPGILCIEERKKPLANLIQ